MVVQNFGFSSLLTIQSQYFFREFFHFLGLLPRNNPYNRTCIAFSIYQAVYFFILLRRIIVLWFCLLAHPQPP